MQFESFVQPGGMAEGQKSEPEPIASEFICWAGEIVDDKFSVQGTSRFTVRCTSGLPPRRRPELYTLAREAEVR